MLDQVDKFKRCGQTAALLQVVDQGFSVHGERVRVGNNSQSQIRTLFFAEANKKWHTFELYQISHFGVKRDLCTRLGSRLLATCKAIRFLSDLVQRAQRE